MIYDKIIDDIFWFGGKLMNAHKRAKKLSTHPNVSSYIKNRYGDSDDLRENLFRIHYHIEERPRCEYCGKPALFVGRQNLSYQRFCSNSCAGKGTDRGKQWFENQKKHNIEKYGVDNNFDLPWLKKERIRAKIRQTCLKRYGVECNLKSEIVKNKIKETFQEKYGVNNPLALKENRDKGKEKLIEKYGVNNPYQIPSVINKIKEKSYITKKRNHTFNTSKPEEELYLYIKEKFLEVKRQYKDKERYPFCCDFYIPSLDYFIELQGHWTHNDHPYDKYNIEDQEILKEWKSKHTKFYDNAIKCWSISDVKKRETAKKNNLNYKEVWSLEEGKKFIDDLYTKRGTP